MTLAESLQQEDGTYVRSYPNGNLAAHVVGYVSQQYGTTAIESVMNDTLTGSKDYSSWNNAIASLAGQTQPGNTAKLTIDSRIQTAAEQALKGFKGAVVVIDPRTGAVLACASSPTYDNTNIDALLQTGGGEDGSMYNRAMDALYTPGSTFKVVTLSAALETGTASRTSTYQAPGSMDIGNAPVTNDANESYGTISLQQAFAVSSNVVFGQVANEVGANTLVQFANAFGYGQKARSGPDLRGLHHGRPVAHDRVGRPPGPAPASLSAWTTPGPQTTVMQKRRDCRRHRQQRRGHGPVLCSPGTRPGRNRGQDHAVPLAGSGRQLLHGRPGQAGHACRRPVRHRHRCPNPRRQSRRQDWLGRDRRHQRQLDVRWLCTLRFTHGRYLGGLGGLRQA